MTQEVYARQSRYSDPGRHRQLLRDLPGDLEALCTAARNTIAHYRAELPDLPEDRRGEIDSRWLERILDHDQARHPVALTEPRALASRVAGCCRDHSLFVTAALREQGVAARTVVGFAGYFEPPFHHDHVVVEYWDGARWVMVDPEIVAGDFAFDVRDMPRGPGRPFETAAQVWRGYRAGSLDPGRYGVHPSSPLRGAEFIAGYVVFQLAHRYRDELLLWDEWVPTPAPEVLDELAELLESADAGDEAAESALEERYRTDAGLHPGAVVTRYSPYGYPPVIESLERAGHH